MRIFLSGLPGSGKSSVARFVGERAGLPVFEVTGRDFGPALVDSAEASDEEMEVSYRSPEHGLLRSIVDENAACVVDLGSETVTHVLTRRFLLATGVLVTLSASPEELFRRRGIDRELSEEGSEALRRRLQRRVARWKDSYAECHAEVETTGKSPDAVADEVLEVARLEPIVIPQGERTCRIEIGSGIRQRVGMHLRRLCKKQSPVLLVTDTGVEQSWGGEMRDILARDGQPVIFVSIPEGESAKQLRTVEKIWDAALSGGLDRSSVVISVGGGVVGDLAGFAAATLLRGVTFAQVPTTLLAMVDSSIGGKTGFDTRQGKNLVGAFHQPAFVLSDVEVLSTLPEAERRAGLAEVVKSAWLDGEASVRRLESDAEKLLAGEERETVAAIRMSASLKARVVASDEREAGPRMLLNLGHTVGHAVEASMHYQGIRHGEAVSLGMVAAFRLAVALGRASEEEEGRVTRLLRSLGLPVELDDYFSGATLSFVGSDKKRRSAEVNFVVPSAPGKVEIVPLPLSDLPLLLKKRL
jgi:shikimate kinase/3-dehydroquinate synthase